MVCSGRAAPVFVTYHDGKTNSSDREGSDEMDTTMMLVRQQVKERARVGVQWRVYRWIGVCAMLVIACLVLLSLVF